MSKTTPFYLRTLSALHAGSGKDNGLVDLPIQRELVTGYPKIEASSLKGALRSRVEQLGADATQIHLAFGYDDQSMYKDTNTDFSGEGSANAYARYFAGALTFTDARMLLFPVRSMWGVFAQATCPYVLKRLAEDLERAGQGSGLMSALDGVALKERQCLLPNSCPLQKGGKVILEEYLFKDEDGGQGQAIANALKTATGLDTTRLIILPDDAFGDFTQLFTERMTRNKIGDNGVVADGALFTEEYLPAEAVLYSLLMAEAPRQPKGEKNLALPDDFKTEDHVNDFITKNCWGEKDDAKKVLQIGGNTTIGKGIVELTFKTTNP